jgi:uncharacterized protein (DUF362 family)/Pyruvate/2-oxoacid:ferredoxin oxidoreductase delta subunit
MSTVSIIECDTYEIGHVHRAVVAALEPLGGIGAFVAPGQRVLLKPNLLAPVPFEWAITTHPAVVEAMVGLVQEVGGVPFIADSPAGPFHTGVGMPRLYKNTGLQEVAKRTGVALRHGTAAVQVPIPDGVLLKRLDLLKVWQESDVVISLPKFKTHGFAFISGAVKNLFGLVPGMAKSGYHSKLADIDRFCDMLLDIVACVRPALSVMDGIVGIEGNGPGLHGKRRDIGVLLASPNAVALDAIMCQIIRADPNDLALFRAAERRGWWPVEVGVKGTPLEEVTMPDFLHPVSRRAAESARGRSRLSRFLTHALIPYPVPRDERCTACGTCVRMCPREAITIEDDLAVVDYDRCIRCYCCHEVCPEAAIDLQFSWVGKLLRQTGLLG